MLRPQAVACSDFIEFGIVGSIAFCVDPYLATISSRELRDIPKNIYTEASEFDDSEFYQVNRI